MIALMHYIRRDHPGMGLRTMHDILKPEGIGHDAFVALGKQHGLCLEPPRSATRTTRSIGFGRYPNLLRGVVINGINQLWTSDITYYWWRDAFWYISVLMDVYSRRIIGAVIAPSMHASHTVTMLKEALRLRGISDYKNVTIHHSDAGVQYASTAYVDTLRQYNVRISMTDNVYENTHIERVHLTLKDQYLDRFTIEDDEALLSTFLRVIYLYNHERPHRSLGLITPVAFESNLESMPVKNRIVFTPYVAPRINFQQLQLELHVSQTGQP
jgi:transposase InsO family protein